jgi:hypothetical protein
LITPTLHLNGSSEAALREPLIEACGALRGALRAMSETQPNARDYYPQGDDAFRAATREHEARIATARKLLAEYEQILDGLQEQIDARDARRERR